MRVLIQAMIFMVALVVGSTTEAQIVLLTQDFEAGSPPSGWSTSQNTPSVGWEFGTDLGSQFLPIPAHGRYAVSNDDAHDDNTATANLADLDYLISPPIDLLAWAGTGIGLHFSYVQPAIYGSVGTVEVRINGGPWVVVATVPPATDWTEIVVDLSAFTTSTIVQIGFHHDDNGFWADGFAVDDVTVSTLPPLDAALDEVLTSGYLPTGGFVDLEGVVSNRGLTTITAIAVEYRINGGPIEDGLIDDLSLPAGDSTTFFHPVPALLPTVGAYQIEMWITDVNGSLDGNPANNLATSEVITVSTVPPKKVILTNHTGAWCGFCPDGYVKLEQTLDVYGNLIGVSVHQGDGMTFAEGDELNSTYITGYPSGLIDIYRFPDLPEVGVYRSRWNDLAGERLHHIVPVSVSLVDISYESATREVFATVRAEFFGDSSGDLRLNLWVVEDGVTGSGPGFDQTNYYNTDPTHPYYGAGDPIVGFVHDRTLRAMLGGTWGTAGIIPPSVGDGDVFTHQYNFVVPAEYDETRINLIGLVSTYDAGNDENRAILNSAQRSLWGIFDDGFEWGDTADWTATSP